MFAEAVRQSSSCFAYVDVFVKRAGYAIDDISGGACKGSVVLAHRVGPEILTMVEIKGQVLHRRFLVGCQT